MSEQSPTQGRRLASRMQAVIARQEIEYLRRRYAKATDLIGAGKAESVAEGRRIYQAIFTPDARIRATSGGVAQLTAAGPDEWEVVVRDALDEYVATQHLIGTQLVDFTQLQIGEDGELTSGSARMTGYLQAWHAREGSVWIYLGEYIDQVRYTPGDGWRIEDMELAQISGEDRPLGAGALGSSESENSPSPRP